MSIFPSRIYLQSRYFRCKNNFPFRWGTKKRDLKVGGKVTYIHAEGYNEVKPFLNSYTANLLNVFLIDLLFVFNSIHLIEICHIWLKCIIFVCNVLYWTAMYYIWLHVMHYIWLKCIIIGMYFRGTNHTSVRPTTLRLNPAYELYYKELFRGISQAFAPFLLMSFLNGRIIFKMTEYKKITSTRVMTLKYFQPIFNL